VTERENRSAAAAPRSGALGWSERGLILEAAVLIAALRLALCVCAVRQVQRVLAATLRSSGGSDTASDVDRQRATHVSRLVDMAARHTVKNTCLHRSLALWWLLGRRGLASQIRIGTRRRHGRFEAHAWVERGGMVVNDSGEPGYEPLVWPPVEHEA
jgi:transglutaminase superfamily protein